MGKSYPHIDFENSFFNYSFTPQVPQLKIKGGGFFTQQQSRNLKKRIQAKWVKIYQAQLTDVTF